MAYGILWNQSIFATPKSQDSEGHQSRIFFDRFKGPICVRFALYVFDAIFSERFQPTWAWPVESWKATHTLKTNMVSARWLMFGNTCQTYSRAMVINPIVKSKNKTTSTTSQKNKPKYATVYMCFFWGVDFGRYDIYLLSNQHNSSNCAEKTGMLQVSARFGVIKLRYSSYKPLQQKKTSPVPRKIHHQHHLNGHQDMETVGPHKSQRSLRPRRNVSPVCLEKGMTERSSRCLNYPPTWKNMLIKMDHFPKGEKKTRFWK